MFEFLFKYSPVVLSKGQLAFKSQLPLSLLVLLVAGLGALLWYLNRKTTIRIGTRFKVLLTAMRGVVFAVIILLLLHPVIRVDTVVPRKSSVLVLVDDSRSMTIKDVGNLTRQKAVMDLLGDSQNPGLTADLRENFRLQLYKFSSVAEPIADCDQLSWQGEETNLAQALERVSDVAQQTSLSGVVLLTDGANTGSLDPLEVANALTDRKIPVFIVGVGDERLSDLELAKVAANHSVIENSVVEVSVLLKNKNTEARSVEIQLSEKGRVVKTERVELTGSATRASLKFAPQKRGFVPYTLSVKPGKGEAITENNASTFLIDNRNKRARILYIEGHPRAEFKYLRRALDGDENIELVSLLRTAVAANGNPPKFYRQGIKNQSELAHGYPKNRKALFKYDAIIFGSIEADFFTGEELQNTLRFVSERGGGFMMIGGALSFSQGGYETTDIAELLPVELDARSIDPEQLPASFRDKYKIQITPDGLRNPILQLSAELSQNRSHWESLPELEGYNPLGRAKPGATILGVHPLSESRNPKIVLAQQKYGRGRTMVWGSASSWLWQMGMNHKDTSHERFWRQVTRWLALSSPSPVEGRFDKGLYTPGEQVTITVDVRDSAYAAVENATLKGQITKPDGEIVDVPFHWTSEGAVLYSASFRPDQKGLYTLRLKADSPKGDFLGDFEDAFFVEESLQEFTNAELQVPLLRRIAEVTGGKYFPLEEAESLADEISVRESSYSKLVEYDLWDMPFIFLLIVLFLGVEWYVRRSRGLS